METILQEDIKQSITAALQKEFISIFKKLNLELEKAFQENTERRREMQKRLEEYEEKWKRQHRKLTARIQDIDEDLDEDDEKTKSVEKDALSDEAAGAILARFSKEDASPSKDSEASPDEPDWESLLHQDHAPTVARIRRYIETLDRLSAAEGKFNDSCEEILGKIDASTKAVLHIAVDVCSPLYQALDSEEQELQDYLVRNMERRQDLAEAVEDVAKQTQSLYARLMASIKHLAGGSKRKREVDDV